MKTEGSTAIITGSSTGIGRAIAVEFGRAGANVVCVARRAEKLKETAHMVEEAGGAALTVPADITRPDHAERMVQQALQRFGRVDVLFNNAGSFASIAGVWEAEPETWWHDVTVNLYGAFLCARAVLPHMMKRNEGIIINMDGGRPTGGTGYACGKAGLMELSKVLIMELKAVGSNVIVLNAGPGLVRTEMTELQATSEAGRRWIPSTRETFDAGGARKPEDIARATVKMVRLATPELAGFYFSPGTDFSALPKQQKA